LSAATRHLRVLCGLLVLASFAPAARAQVAAGVAAGVAASSAARPAPTEITATFPGSEPQDWLDPRTKSTSVLARACGVVAELSITVTNDAAFLNLVLLNESREVMGFEPGGTLVQLSHGQKRRVKRAGTGDIVIHPGWRQWLSLQLPTKTELRGQSSLGVELPLMSPSLGACRLRSRIARPPSPEREETFRRYSMMELSFGGGPRLLTTGALHELAPRVGAAFGLDILGFWSLHHGLALDLALETPGRGAVAKVAPNNGFDGKASVEAAGFFLGYVLRFYPVGRLSIAYSPELGVIPFQLTEGSGQREVRETSAIVCPKHRLRVMLPVAPLLDGSFTLGLSVSHTYVPYGRLGEADLSGNLLSTLLLLGVAG
jgi:hypothetical protein